MRPASGRGVSRQARGRSGREDGGATDVAAQSLAAAASAAAATTTVDEDDSEPESDSEDKPARDLPFLPDESSWLQDPNNVRGLRSVSVRMCHLLRQKQTCTCNEVADQLTEESQSAGTREPDAKSDSGSPVPEKNLRRRIYDALNVLASAGVVAKDGEVVHWRGLPDHIEISALQAEKRQLQISIATKKRLAAEIREKRAAFEALLKRNRDPQFSREHEQSARLAMPFVSIVAHQHTQIERVDATPRSSAVALPTTDAGDAPAATVATAPEASTAHSTPQQGTRRTTRSASAPPSASQQAEAVPKTAAAPEIEYELSGKFSLQDDADVLKQMVRAGALKRRRLDLDTGPEGWV